MFVYYFVIAGLIVADVFADDVWTYEEQDIWNPAICIQGSHQSPIALSRAIAAEGDFSPFSLYGYGQSMTTLLQNNGHSVKIKPKYARQIPEIHGGGLKEVYKFDHLHFHWQSEHTVEGDRLPLEMHMVHFSQKYGNFDEASKHTDEGGIAVFAVLFHVSPDDFQEFNPVLNAVIEVQNQIDQEKELDGFVIKHFLPSDLAGYYRYNGSLTTPGCSEGIIWTVFLHTMPISVSQVAIFREIRTHQQTPLQENFRQLQPLNDRNVLIKISPMPSGSNKQLPSKIVLVIFLSLYYLFR